MRRSVLLAFLFVSQLYAQEPYSEFVASSQPRTPAEEQKAFHLPPGFAIELVAAEPAIIKPINMNFDDRGRLWVTQSVEYPFPASGDRKPQDTVKILECSKGDGFADKVTTFADGLNIPIGVLPLKNAALVYSIPNVYGLYDTQGAGHADKREILLSSFGHRDTHGMTGSFTWGFDGWVYACHGFSNTSAVKAKDGSSIEMNSGNTYRFRVDGSHVEQFTHGQVNPFGLTFDPLGNLYSADCHTRPIMMLLRDGYYDSFGKPHDGLGYAPDMCDHDHGSTAIAGIIYYAADQFPKEYHDHVFMGNVVTNRINHDRLEKHGSTLKAIEQPDFLTCDDPWFRPVDLKLGPDGAIYVADFYNRIIGHYEVPLTHPGRDHERGRIWRITYRGSKPPAKDPAVHQDWDKATIDELIAALAHPNLVIRMKATNQLCERPRAESVAAVQRIMQPGSQPEQRMHGLWVLERQQSLDDAILVNASKDPAEGVRVHAMRVLANRGTLNAAQNEMAIKGLHDPEAIVRRCAAEALGSRSSVKNLQALLALRHSVPADDTHLLYVARKALRDQLKPQTIWSNIAWDSLTERDHRVLADVAPGVPSAEAAAFLLKHLSRWPESKDNVVRYSHHVARYGNPEVVNSLLGMEKAYQPGDLRLQAALLRAHQQGTLERGAKVEGKLLAWAQDLTSRLLMSANAEFVQISAEIAGSLRLASTQTALQKTAADKRQPEPARNAALEALLAIDASTHWAEAGAILADAGESNSIREHAARVLGGINQAKGHAALAEALSVAPAPVQSAIASALAGSPHGADLLVKAVAAGKGSPRLLQEWWVHIQLSKQPALNEEVARLTKALPTADKRLQETTQKRRATFANAKTSVTDGARIFEKNCSICHQLAGRGAKVGPQLDGVGNRGLDRLLEDIIDPNRNVDLAFRSSTLSLKSGQILTGLVLREEGELLVLADNQGKEVRIPKSSIEERSTTQLSPMPANFVDQVPESDFYNLLAFLLAQRPPAR
jgi:putative heme-binding domain-containing protein